MKKSKNNKKDHESNKLIFFQIGLIVALASVLYAFEYKSYEKYDLIEYDRYVLEEPTIFIIQTKHPPPPPIPKPPPVNIVVDKTDLIEEGRIEIDVLANEKTEVKKYIPVFEPEPEILDNKIIPIAEEQPTYPGGYAAMMKFLDNNIVYPRVAKEVNITGRVYIEFVVEKDGSLSNMTVLKGIGGGCEEEALRVLRLMPKWNCGKQNHIPVRVRLTLPIKFSLL